MAGTPAMAREGVGRPPAVSFQLYRGPAAGGHPAAAREPLPAGRASGRGEAWRPARSVAAGAKRARKAEDFAFSANELRPWTHQMPTLYEILEDDAWPVRVKDWRVFWGVFRNWQETWAQLWRATQGDETTPPPLPMQQLVWLQLEPEDCDRMEEAIDRVVAKIPDLLRLGIPVPKEIEGKKPWTVGHYEVETFMDARGSLSWRRGAISGVNPLFARPEAPEEPPEWPDADNVRPWDDWDENELRAWVEKRKAHRQRQAAFAASQAALNSRRYLIASPQTDYRYAKQAAFYPVDPRPRTHEEYMAAVLCYGKAVDPRTIPVRIQNPAEYADAFKEGVHWVEEPIDAMRALGHVTDHEEDLVGLPADAPSATMDEEFSEDDPASGAGPTVDEVDNEFGEGLDVMADGPYEEFEED